MKYEVVEGPELYILEEIVNEMLEDGWNPQGGLCSTKCGTTTYYSQAMLKHDEVKISIQPPKIGLGVNFDGFVDKYIK